jgi:hypothetical protein
MLPLSAGLGAQVRGRLGGVVQFEREHVPGEAVTPGERQAMARALSRTSKLVRSWVPSSVAMGLPSGMRKDAAVKRCSALHTVRAARQS